MSEPTREELLAQIAELQRQLAAQRSDHNITTRQISGNVATGPNVRQIQANAYYEQVIADPTQATPASLRAAYLAHLMGKEVGPLNLLGVDPTTAFDDAVNHLRLDAVYTALLTRHPEHPISPTPKDQGTPHLSALAALNQEHRLVLLGDPGSGKSTFVNFVALCLAGENLEQAAGQPFAANLNLLTAPLPTDEGEDSTKPQPWTQGPLLPIRILLRDFAAHGLPAAGKSATAKHLWAFIGHELRNAGLPDYILYLRKELLERGGLLLLDGLDEVPDVERRRPQLKQAIEHFAATFRRCRILVTSRTYAYQQPVWRLDRFAVVQLAPFSAGQIRRFIDRWYTHTAEQRHQAPTDAQGRAALLKQAIFASDRLHMLATRPLLLTLMASLHAWRGGNLPERREELYADAVDLLLHRWELQRVQRDATGALLAVAQPSLAEYLKVDRSQLLAALNRLAFQVHAIQHDLVDVANIAEQDLVAALLAISRNAQANPVLLMDYLSHRAGLLLPHGIGVYTFPHRTFQEYLAACHLTDEGYPDQVAELVRNNPNRWREVALLAGAKATRGATSAFWSLIDALTYRNPTDPAYSTADHWGALLAGQAVAETVNLATLSPRYQAKITQLRDSLLHLMRTSVLPALERARAGRLLALLGDPRPEVLSVEQMHFCAVPAGPFMMDDGEEQYPDTIAYPYWISRYPITNAQFQRFIEAEGYANPTYWGEAIKAGYWQAGAFKGRWDTNPRRGPVAYDPPFVLPNHPVVGVSWYEALAFTRWLTDHLHAQALLPTAWRIILPSEAEWEKAARGGDLIPHAPQPFALSSPLPAPSEHQPNPSANRRYPWGEELDTDRLNCQLTNIGATSAVGCFPTGASPYGVEELAGNVWEWTRGLYGFAAPYNPSDGREDLTAPPPSGRVLRGGSWYEEISTGGCGVRDGYIPGYRYDYNGFRVVASPILR